MAAPITHIVLTDKVFNKYFQDKEKKDFFVGTSLPDIRYLKVIARNKVHFNNLNLDKIKQENSFLAGLKFHSLLDKARENFVVSKDIYSLCPKSEYIIQSLKLLEDDILYDKIQNWQEFIDFFDEILPEELALDISKESLNKWHKILQKYFSKQPNDDTRKILLTDLGFSEEIAKEINENIKQMKDNQEIIQIIKELYNNLESIQGFSYWPE